MSTSLHEQATIISLNAKVSRLNTDIKRLKEELKQANKTIASLENIMKHDKKWDE